MRAYELGSFDGPDALVLSELQDPEPGSSLVVDVRAIGVNFPDLLASKGQLQDLPDLPAVLGSEIAGVVSSAPQGSDWKVGDRIAAYLKGGGYAERVAVPVSDALPVADDADFATGAALVVNYHTASFAVAYRGRVTVGETVLVLGAAGGIGTAAVQIAKAHGARVIGGVADEVQLPIARAAGADHAIVLRPGFSAELMIVTEGVGSDLIVDPLGGDVFDEAVRCLAPEGRIVVMGFAAGGIPSVKVNRLLMRNVEVIGAAWGGPSRPYTPTMAEQGAAVARMYSEGHLRPQIGNRFPFEQLPDALRLLEGGGVRGKAVVEIS
jgi:NADPH2:quinone reductase